MIDNFFRQSSDEGNDDEDSSLRELIRICEALTRPPNQGKLKKSKSMVKKSKSMIMTAKDIPMNAFMAMKNSAEDKDEKWLQNFLSESLVEEIPWECSKALIILKEGYQAIIPREASRSILLGEASYTLIDDNGVEFYLSPKDKMNRRKQGLDDNIKKVTLNEDPIHMDEKPSSGPERVPLQYSTENVTPKMTTATSNGHEMNGKAHYGVDLDDSLSEMSKRRPTRRGPAYLDEVDDEDALMSSLEKYRPSAYEIGRPKDSDDINDIRDYYTNMMTKQRALTRFVPNLQRTRREDPYEYDDQPSNGYGNLIF